MLFFLFVFVYSTLKSEERSACRDGGDLVRFTAFQQARIFREHDCGGLILRLYSPKTTFYTQTRAVSEAVCSRARVRPRRTGKNRWCEKRRRKALEGESHGLRVLLFYTQKNGKRCRLEAVTLSAGNPLGSARTNPRSAPSTSPTRPRARRGADQSRNTAEKRRNNGVPLLLVFSSPSALLDSSRSNKSTRED